MSKTELSIIVPVYNGKKYLQECVESLRKIDCSKEIILLDDASFDGSYQYCLERWGGLSEIRIVRKTHGGITDTRNAALALARGEYLLFADQDDVAVADTVSKAVHLAVRKNLDGVIWSTVRLMEQGNTVSCDKVLQSGIMTEQEIQNGLLPDMLMNTDNSYVTYLGHIWAGIYRRELVQGREIHFQSFVDAEDDYLFVLKFLCEASSVALLREEGYQWRYNQQSETYRQKYIHDLMGKYQQLYQYIDQVMEKVPVQRQVREKYTCYRVQTVALRALENCFQYFSGSREERRSVYQMLRENRTFFLGTSAANLGGRQKRLYALLRRGLFHMAGFYVYLDSVYRAMHRKSAQNEKRMERS